MTKLKVKKLPETKKEAIQIALKHFDEALKVYTKKEYPREWANVMNNKGIAYGILGGIPAEKFQKIEIT